jgi:hypothetical protein
MQIFDGSAQVNPIGEHSGLIQVEGFAESSPHEILARCFPDTYPNIPESRLYTNYWGITYRYEWLNTRAASLALSSSYSYH